MAFFGPGRMTVDFRVNGEVIMTAVNSQSNVVHHSQSKWQGRASFQALTGLSVIEYVALPANAKITIAFHNSGAHNSQVGNHHNLSTSSQQETKQGEGFLQLRKL